MLQEIRPGQSRKDKSVANFRVRSESLPLELQQIQHRPVLPMRGQQRVRLAAMPCRFAARRFIVNLAGLTLALPMAHHLSHRDPARDTVIIAYVGVRPHSG